MRYFKRFFSVLSILLFGLSSLVLGQNNSTEVDSSYEAYIEKAWDKVGEARQSEEIDADSLQRHYANEFYDYYLKNQQTKTGANAFQSAFTMWSNIGYSEHLNEALQTLNNDSQLWRRVIHFVGNIYHADEELEYDAYLELLNDLKDRLTHPESRSAVILHLLRSNLDDDPEKAKRLAQQLIEIDATEFYVEHGRGYLHELESLNIGQKAPDFNAQTVEGNEISLSDLNGQYVLLDFWATWCGPCLPEIPHLKDLWNRYKDENFKIVGISSDGQKSKLTKFLNNRDMEWPQILETEGWKGEISKLYNVKGIPRTYLINPDGEIIAKDLRGEEMIEEIDKHYE